MQSMTVDTHSLNRVLWFCQFESKNGTQISKKISDVTVGLRNICQICSEAHFTEDSVPPV